MFDVFFSLDVLWSFVHWNVKSGFSIFFLFFLCKNQISSLIIRSRKNLFFQFFLLSRNEEKNWNYFCYCRVDIQQAQIQARTIKWVPWQMHWGFLSGSNAPLRLTINNWPNWLLDSIINGLCMRSTWSVTDLKQS